MANDMAVRIAEDLETVAQAIDDCFNSLAGTHSPDSIYAGELASGYDRPKGEPGVGGIRIAVGSAYLTLASTADHLHSARRLMIDHRGEASIQRYAVLSVLRVALETASLTYWLVDPSLVPKERLERGLRYAEYSRRLRWAALQATPEQTSNRAFTEVKESIRRTAEYHGVDRIVQKLRAGKDMSIPDAVNLVGKLFASIPDAGPDAAEVGQATYRLASEQMHGNIYGMFTGYRLAGPLDASQDLMYPKTDLGAIAVVADNTVIAVDRAVQAFFYLMGWSPIAWSEATLDAQQALGRIGDEFRQPSAR